MRRSKLRVVFPDTHPREVSPRSPRASAPTSDTVQVDPQDMGYAQAERAEPKTNPLKRSCDRAGPYGACAPRSFLLTHSSTFCHQRCVRDGMEARSRACTRPHR